ncbi:MAG TPA: hypothetical protein PLI09_00595 [Candidatus Hydrogenedentes bacterium]|nr:hypothetical protein [Candidatus Hydrogenedentota bacterium]
MSERVDVQRSIVFIPLVDIALFIKSGNSSVNKIRVEHLAHTSRHVEQWQLWV